MAENGEWIEKQFRLPESTKNRVNQLVSQKAFWDGILRDSEKENFESLTRLFASCSTNERCGEYQLKREEKYAELEDSLKYLVSLLAGVDSQITAINGHLQNMVDNIAV